MALKHKITYLKERERELGFGGGLSGARQINKDGSSNIERKGVHHFSPLNIYHTLVTMSWTRFCILILIAYLIINLFFACIYYFLIGVNQLGGMQVSSEKHKFLEAFFFSAQTITTVGYGRISPSGLEASAVAALESLFGLLAFALATGLLYGRFSRPTAKILFSENAVIAPYREGKAFMFKIANARTNPLIEVEASMFIAYDEMVNGKSIRRFQAMKAELSKISFLALSWTIVHPVNDESPLNGISEDDLKTMNAEIFILLKAVDDTYAQQVHARSSYRAEDIIWNAKFRNIIEQTSDGKMAIDINRINEYEMVN
jgi:inward rectifier potassium channel